MIKLIRNIKHVQIMDGWKREITMKKYNVSTFYDTRE